MSLVTLQAKFSLTPEQLLILDSEINKRKPIKAIAFMFWFFSGLGILGLHRFYLHNYKAGIFMLITLGGFFIFAFTDIFRIDRICKERTEQIELEILDEINMMNNAKKHNINIQKL